MSAYGFIDKNNGIPLYIQLKQAIINDINTGKYENMQKLPSRRKLAEKLNFSTTTVNNAYQALVDEGYAITIDRSGFYVKSSAAVADDYYDVVWEDNREYLYNFSYNSCETSGIPSGLPKILNRLLQNADPKAFLKHGNKRGETEFRISIAKFLYSSRGIDCLISDIFLGSGVQHLLTVIVMILGRDKVYGLENPTDYKMYLWLKNLGVDIRLVNVDLSGSLDPDTLDKLGIDVMLVMPENQLPTGRRMSAEERRDLADWCKRDGKYIIEVGTDGHLNYSDKMLKSIYTEAGGRNVIYMESFEFLISPNTKAAYMALPTGLVNFAIKRLETYSPLVTAAEQTVYQNLINSGKLARLIAANNKTMKNKRDFLISRINTSKLGGRFRFLNTDTGMNLIGIFESGKNGVDLSCSALSKGVKIFEMTKFLLSPNPIIDKNAFVFGYAGLNIPEIDDAVKILENSWGDM